MDTNALESTIREWIGEFDSLGGDSEKLPAFLARRIVESGITNTEEPHDIIRVRVGSEWRRVQIVGLRGPMIEFNYTGGSVGYGLCNPSAIHKDDMHKAATFLDAQGKL